MKRQDPQNPEELRNMLHTGMGRAILFLMNQDLSAYRDLILDSCLHNHAYNLGAEGTRVDYLFPLISAHGEYDYYRKQILYALVEEKNSWNAEQLLDFAVRFAREGDERAREAIYEKLRKDDTDDRLTGGEQVIELDGVGGLVFLLDLAVRDPAWMSDHQYFIRNAEEGSSTEDVRLALKKAASENPNIAAVLANLKNYSVDWTADEIVRHREEWRQDTEDFSKNRTWQEVSVSPVFDRLAFYWPRVASEEELVKAAMDLDPEAEPDRLWRHISIFTKRPFPLEPSRLISLLDHPNDRVVISALYALEIVRHDEVRDLFHRLLDRAELSDRAIGFLRSNYRSGDHELITSLLEQETDPDRLHLMCIDTMHVYRDNPVPEGLEPLLAVYEKDPCSMCRWTCLITLEEIGAVPEWMIEECLYDAQQGTRELAGKLKR